jgi:predicted PurR-regulated permease PerM
VNADLRQRVARGVAAAVLLLLGIWVLRGFVPALAWGVVIALSSWPWRDRLAARIAGRHRDGIAALLLTAAVALVVLVPLTFGIVQAAREARSLAAFAHAYRESGIPAPDWMEHLPRIGPAVAEWWRSHLADPGQAQELLGRIDSESALGAGRRFTASLLHRAVTFGFTVLALFFLYRDGGALATQALALGRSAFGPPGERYLRHIVDAIRATVNGLTLVGLGEGLLLGIAYWVAGLSHPALLGLVTGVTAMVPFAAPVVYGAASLVLLATGEPGAALALFVFGSVVLFVADHFVRPALIGGAVRLPFLWVLLGILGGIETIGLLGLFLGPALMAALVSIWRELGEDGPSGP